MLSARCPATHQLRHLHPRRERQTLETKSSGTPRRILMFGGGLPLQNFDGRSCEKVTAEGEAISCSQRHGGAHESAEDAAQAIPQMPIVTKKGCPQLEVQISKIKTVHHRDASARQRVSGSPARCHELGPDLGRPHVYAARARIQPHAFTWRAGLPSADATPVTAPIPCRLHPSATRPLRSFLLRVQDRRRTWQTSVPEKK